MKFHIKFGQRKPTIQEAETAPVFGMNDDGSIISVNMHNPETPNKYEMVTTRSNQNFDINRNNIFLRRSCKFDPTRSRLSRDPSEELLFSKDLNEVPGEAKITPKQPDKILNIKRPGTAIPPYNPTTVISPHFERTKPKEEAGEHISIVEFEECPFSPSETETQGDKFSKIQEESYLVPKNNESRDSSGSKNSGITGKNSKNSKNSRNNSKNSKTSKKFKKIKIREK